MTQILVKPRKTTPDVFCKLCFLPEGDSRFLRVGKRKVRHEDCAGAWPAAEVAKGRNHVIGLQIEREERLLEESAAKLAEKTEAGSALPESNATTETLDLSQDKKQASNRA